MTDHGEGSGAFRGIRPGQRGGEVFRDAGVAVRDCFMVFKGSAGQLHRGWRESHGRFLYK
jgi:hypothetical protein